MSTPKRYGCQDYRSEMLMVGLQTRLQQEDLSEEERRRIVKALSELEAEFFD